ncbi:hypothetical protein [Photobacterium sp. OFAV2-7]|uniref:hypothetical protein n=1 Tax=Photobacterium sp. OFAV2-7 TaxID=2917748 RepID=UPI001EF6A506|nr:hypothetical protein [Photobacterium sp. OFAV2-7]MCG7584579.1 hypothetical protein [Photobacterium sp. OFAV2-7]
MGMGNILLDFITSIDPAATVWFTGLFTLVAALIGAGKLADDCLAKELKEQMTAGLNKAQEVAKSPKAYQLWLMDFNNHLELAFGQRHWSWRCVILSTVISVLTLAMLTIVFMPDANLGVLFLLIVGLAYNALGDYLSLWETRLVLKSAWSLQVKLIVDAVMTILIWSLGILIGTCFLSLTKLVPFEDYGPVNMTIDIIQSVVLALIPVEIRAVLGLPMHTDNIEFVNSLATSFTTSLWLWLHALSYYTLRACGIFRFFDTTKPGLAMALVTSFYLLLFGTLAYFL